MQRLFHLLAAAFLTCAVCQSAPEDDPEFIDPNVIEMSPFVVYGGIIDTIDGFTEQEYHGSELRFAGSHAQAVILRAQTGRPFPSGATLLLCFSGYV